MSVFLKTGLLVFSGALLGATVWLWLRVGSDVFLTYAESVALWCF